MLRRLTLCAGTDVEPAHAELPQLHTGSGVGENSDGADEAVADEADAWVSCARGEDDNDDDDERAAASSDDDTDDDADDFAANDDDGIGLVVETEAEAEAEAEAEVAD